MQCGFSSRDSPHGTEINSRIWLCLFMNTFQCCLFRMRPIFNTIMTLPSIAIEVFGKTQAGETRGCGAHFCQCRIGNSTMISISCTPCGLAPGSWFISSSRGYFHIPSMMPVIAHEAFPCCMSSRRRNFKLEGL